MVASYSSTLLTGIRQDLLPGLKPANLPWRNMRRNDSSCRFHRLDSARGVMNFGVILFIFSLVKRSFITLLNNGNYKLFFLKK